MAPPQVLLNLTRALSLTPTLPSSTSSSTLPSPLILTGASNPKTDYDVLILGGGIAGVMAARELSSEGIDSFLIIEARPELGGRLMSHTLTNGLTIELGANWIEGLHSSASFHFVFFFFFESGH